MLRETVQYSITFCRLLEVANDVISSIFVSQTVVNNVDRFGYPGLHRCRDVRLKVVLGGIWDAFIAVTANRKYVISSTSIEDNCLDV